LNVERGEKMKKILVPVDGSEQANRACSIAKDLALKFDSDIILVTVVSPNEYASNRACLNCGSTLLKHEIEGSKEMLLEIKESFGNMAERVETKYLEGDIASEILACAEREQADLIVMGSRGLGVFSRSFLGSISNKIVNHSDISVLIVK
jgi:nucleotide-binding universal stress UspA family protein